MAWLNQYDHFVPEEHLASVVGIAAEMGKARLRASFS